MTEYFYKNTDADEVLFIHEGTGKLRTQLGTIEFEYGDYLVIPRGMIYQIDFDTTDNRLLFVESASPIQTPKRYRNNFGQLLEHSPFCERDFRLPQDLKTHDEKGEFLVYIKKNQMMYPTTYQYHPFGAIGWDYTRIAKDMKHIYAGFGGGFRLHWNKTFVIRADMAISPEEQFSPKIYIKVGHVF